MASFCRNRYLDCRSVAAVVLGSMAILRSYGRTWRDRVVVVTGGTSGIGREFALRLAAEGAKVIACARKEVTLSELHTRFPQIEAIRCDVTVTPDVLALEAAIQDRYGRVDVLINNAGIMERVDLLDRSVSDERIAQEIAVNLTSPILLTRRLLPLLRCGRNPMIIMVTSGYALLPATRAPTYSATKAGLHSFTMALRRQLQGVGIRVVEVFPPLVDTPATRSVRQRKMSPETLVGRVLRDIDRGRDETLPGKAGLLPLLMRLAPSYAARRVAGT
ncbi:MAG: SDR family NAD(P)-dependent oxidoreductase [Xanthobacteraceae bacterium]